jgi:hypothetical protein
MRIIAVSILLTTMLGAHEIPATLEETGWSLPVEGISVRLLSQKQKYRVGENILLRRELQNVSKQRIVLENLDLLPLIHYPNKHPFGADHGYEWTITYQTPDRISRILWAREQVLRKARTLTLVRPGQVEVVEVVGCTNFRDLERKDEPRRLGVPDLQHVHFLGGESGKYILKAAFQADDDAKARSGGWPGRKLESPAIEIEIVE